MLCFKEEDLRASVPNADHSQGLSIDVWFFLTSLCFGVNEGDQLRNYFCKLVTPGPLGSSISIGNVPVCVLKTL